MYHTSLSPDRYRARKEFANLTPFPIARTRRAEMNVQTKISLSVLSFVLSLLTSKSISAATESTCLGDKNALFSCVTELAAAWQAIDIEYIERKFGAKLVPSSKGNSPSGQLYRWRRDKNWLDLVLTDTNNRPTRSRTRTSTTRTSTTHRWLAAVAAIAAMAARACMACRYSAR